MPQTVSSGRGEWAAADIRASTSSLSLIQGYYFFRLLLIRLSPPQMLQALEENAEAKVTVEAKVTDTVRRASVLVDPARVAQNMDELKEAELPTEEAAKVVNEMWTRRANRSECLA